MRSIETTGGPRAPLANPQACGTASSTSDVTPWSTPVTPDALSSSAFNVDWDGQGGACPAGLPFSPGFSAGTVTPPAGAFSPFTVTITRHDREQDLSGISVTTPPGVSGVLKGVQLCGEPQAAQGTCPARVADRDDDGRGGCGFAAVLAAGPGVSHDGL